MIKYPFNIFFKYIFLYNIFKKISKNFVLKNYFLYINIYNVKKWKIIKYKTSINKIKASTLKEIGFKSKLIAKKFAKLTDVNPKEYINEESLLTALKNKLNNFKKLGLEFNYLVKSIDTSSPKIQENRQKKQEKKIKEIKVKIDEFKQKREQQKQNIYIKILDEKLVDYFFKSEITEKSLVQTSEHYLNFRDFKMPTNKNYIPWERQNTQERKLYFYPLIMIYIMVIWHNLEITYTKYTMIKNSHIKLPLNFHFY